MKIKAILVLTLALALFAAPQALAGPRGMALRAAKAECKAERAELGRDAFREQYGRRAMRKCAREHMPEAIQAIRNAAQECRAEREADLDAFRLKYGTEGSNRRNAFGKCVSQKAREKLAEEPEDEAPADGPGGG